MLPPARRKQALACGSSLLKEANLLKRINLAGQKPNLSDKALAKAFAGRADAARDEGRYREAAVLYEEAMRLGASGGGVRVQAGHMFKEAGDLATAERYYLEAADLMPNDADLALQLGHFYKVAGRLRDAQLAYNRALSIKSGWDAPLRELAHLAESGWAPATDPESPRPFPIGLDPDHDANEIVKAATYKNLAPELMPVPVEDLLHRNGESIHFRRLGRIERTYWGDQVTLRGVEAIRGFCISEDPILEMQILLNGVTVHRGPTRAYPLHNEIENFKLRKYVFNVWLDLQDYLPGKYSIEVRFRDAKGTRDKIGGRRMHRQDVIIAKPLPEPDFEGGDAWTPLTDPADPRSIDEQINSRPSIVSEAKRRIFREPIKNVLVLRTDQLGDIVISVPAVKRLREILPDAHIVGLFTSANADLAKTLGYFDEVITIDFPDDKEVQRKRVMTAEQQELLRARLAPYKFDLAFDLAPAVASRPLLLLSGAKMLAGMRDRVWPYITANFDFYVYDAVGRSDIIPASGKTAAFIEALNIMINPVAEVVRRPDLDRSVLETLGIGPADRFVILHTGARVIFSRWAHYPELANRLLGQTDLKVVMLSEDKATREMLPAELLENYRFQLLDQRLDFDVFDALLSFCACFVGNDSGPKHLASLRGSNVVSLHTARINWGEWGQELTGTILHRQVPCAGCHVYNDPEECGRDIVCVSNISVDEVWNAMQPYL
jgi:ADP-heptose:LPS heptosyltransferase